MARKKRLKFPSDTDGAESGKLCELPKPRQPEFAPDAERFALLGRAMQLLRLRDNADLESVCKAMETLNRKDNNGDVKAKESPDAELKRLREEQSFRAKMLDFDRQEEEQKKKTRAEIAARVAKEIGYVSPGSMEDEKCIEVWVYEQVEGCNAEPSYFFARVYLDSEETEKLALAVGKATRPFIRESVG